MKQSQRREKATAYHEAGHSVMALLQGIRVSSATIIPAKDFHGQVRTAAVPLEGKNLEIDHIPPRIRDRLEKYARYLLAGDIAQRRFDRYSVRTWQAHDDRHNAVAHLEPLAGSGREIQAWLDLLSIQTEQLIEFWWFRVEAMAKALLDRKHLSSTEIRRIDREAIKAARTAPP
jgi:fido (protein-threonine AMPylation protein)